MADAVITWAKAYAPVTPVRGSGLPDHPVLMGSSGRTEAIAIGVASVQSTTSAQAGENYVRILPAAACWVAIGANPTAEVLVSGGMATGVSWPLVANVEYQFSVAMGHKVAVIT